MRRHGRFLVVGTVMLALACAARSAPAAEAPGQAPDKATTLRVEPSAFGEPRVELAKSLPPKFSVALSREMPTPGYSFTVDAVEIDTEARRIVARVTERAPEGMVAQVLTEAWLKLDLGTLDPGRYFLELYLRDDPKASHRPAHAVLLEAS